MLFSVIGWVFFTINENMLMHIVTWFFFHLEYLGHLSMSVLEYLTHPC